MSVQLIPAPLPELARKAFSFEPAIRGVAHNQWTLRRATWNELIVTNSESGQELSVPRRFIGEVFYTDPAMPSHPAASEPQDSEQIVELLKELEYKSGRVLPRERGLVEMPPVNREPRPAIQLLRGEGWQAPVIAIRVEPESDSTFRRALRGSVAVGFLACLALVFFIRDAHLGSSFGITTSDSRPLPLTEEDDYTSVINKLGRPSSDRWFDAPDGGGYRRLGYPRKRLAVILAGETRESSHYAGALGRDGSVVHSAQPSVLSELTVRSPWR